MAYKIVMTQGLDLTLFYITDWGLVKGQHNMVHMNVVLKRKIQTEIITTYLPSLLLMVITFATTFFKDCFFEAALTVNLTTMLVITTIFTTKIQELPPTSDTKMIDFWLIFCMLYPFAEVILLTLIEYLRKDMEIVKDKTTKWGSGQVEIKVNKRSLWSTMKTVGEAFFKIGFLYNCILSEEKVVPGIFLGCLIIYFIIAYKFYSE